MRSRFFTRTAPPEVPEEVPEEVPAPGTEKALETNEKQPGAAAEGDVSDSDAISMNAQDGVRDIEAMTKVWSRSHLILAYILIWLIYFVNSLAQGSTGNLATFITSDFSAAPLTATTGIMSSLIGGLFRLPLAKVIDLWGRPQGYVCMVVCLTIGLVMMAACTSVEVYAAAQVFYWLGYDGMLYIINVFVSDTTHVKNRGLMFAWVFSPYIITAWVNGRLSSAFLYGPGYRWCYGAFAVIMPFISMSLWVLLFINYRKAKKMGVLPERPPSGRTKWQSCKHYFIEFDIAGLLILCTGLALFLLAFNIYSYQTEGWKAPIIICFLVIGFLLIVGFCFWEKYVAPVTFIPFEILKDRTCLGAFVMAGSVFISFYLWDSYFYAFLLVVQNLDVTNASYVTNTYNVGSCFFSFMVGWAIRATGRVKWIAVFFAVPVTILGAGLMIAFREPDSKLGYIIMCQIFIALAGGGITITEQVAALAATSHQYIAVVLAIENMFSSVGGAIGSSIAVAIWTGVFPKKLAAYLPAEEQGNLTAIYGSTTIQLEYPIGSPTRDAIIRSYGETQKLMLIAATAVLIIPWVAAFCWRDINVKKVKQTKGNVI